MPDRPTIPQGAHINEKAGLFAGLKPLPERHDRGLFHKDVSPGREGFGGRLQSAPKQLGFREDDAKVIRQQGEEKQVRQWQKQAVKDKSRKREGIYP